MSKKIYIGSTEIAGSDGKSAYQSWLDQGNTGTEAQFLASLQGNSGYSGAVGELEVVNNLTDGGATAALSAQQGVVLKGQINQLGLKVDNMSGKYYGVFTSAAVLPAGTDEGYAFVGTEAPFAIYNFNGTTWSNSGATINGITGADGVGFKSVTSAQDGTIVITLTNGDTITVDLNHQHPQYITKEAGTSQPAGGFLPDVVYELGTITGNVTFALAAAVTGFVNNYFWTFDTGSTLPTVTFPSGITWADGQGPQLATGKHYEISVLNGIGLFMEV